MGKQDMAEQSQRQKTEFEQHVDGKVKEAMVRMQMEQSKKEFAKKKQALASRAAEFIMQYGKDDYRSQIMMTFLDVSLQMEDAINLLHDVNTAMSCIGEAIGCMDDILSNQELILENSLQQNYGFFARLKRKRKLNKAIKNNAGRMKQVCDSLVGSQKMAIAIVSSLKKSSLKMQVMMEKNIQKQKKQELKQKAAASSEARSSKAEEMVAEIVAAKGGNYQPSAPAAGSATGTAPAPKSGGVDDISDIT